MSSFFRYQVFNHEYHQRTFVSFDQASAYASECQEFSRVDNWAIPARFTVRHQGEVVFDATQEQDGDA